MLHCFVIHMAYAYGKEYSQCCELRPAACRPHLRSPSRAQQKPPALLHAPEQPAHHHTPNLIRYTHTVKSIHSAVSFAQQHVSLVSTCHVPLCRCFQARCREHAVGLEASAEREMASADEAYMPAMAYIVSKLTLDPNPYQKTLKP